MPVDARYWYYDSATFEYRAYANTAEVLAYLIGDDRKGATVQIGTDEYWFKEGIADGDLIQKLSGVYVDPFIYNLPVGTATPIIIDFENNTIKKGASDRFVSQLKNRSINCEAKPNPAIYFQLSFNHVSSALKWFVSSPCILVFKISISHADYDNEYSSNNHA